MLGDESAGGGVCKQDYWRTILWVSTAFSVST
jgi:hypothetical protein